MKCGNINLIRDRLKRKITMITLNIPHASLYIPEDIHFLLSEDEIKKEALLMADLYTDELFEDTTNIDIIKANVSRIVVDTERFTDDKIETASQYGMGVIYTRTHTGAMLRQSPNPKDKKCLLDAYYYPHHRRLSESVAKNLSLFNRSLIIDLHSYPSNVDIMGIGNKASPDICIGFEPFHGDKKILDRIIAFCNQNHFSYEFNNPFSGSIVPLQYYQKNHNVISFMLEIKRSVYMDEQTYTKNKKFNTIKKEISLLLQDLDESFYRGQYE